MEVTACPAYAAILSWLGRGETVLRDTLGLPVSLTAPTVRGRGHQALRRGGWLANWPPR